MDFDGTLAEIVENPGDARPVHGTAGVLSKLAEVFARVAVISGRPVEYLASQLEGAGATELVGLYGMQRSRRGADGVVRVEESDEARTWRGALDSAASEAESAAPAGVAVERKGLAVTLHYRRAPERTQWAAEFAAALANRRGLVAHDGKMSVELRPPLSTDKGTVLSELAGGMGAVFFAGDDVGDLPAFEVLSRLRAVGVTTLGVAVAGAETPEAVTAVADLVVDGPKAVIGLLGEMAGAAGGAGAA